MKRWLLTLLLTLGSSAFSQTPFVIYNDSLLNGFQDYSWAPHLLGNPSPVQSGSDSISVQSIAWEAIWLQHATFSTAPYTNLVFWVNGGSGGQIIAVQGVIGNSGQGTYLTPPLAANTWQQFTLPMSTIGISNTSCNGIWWQLTDKGTTNNFYLDSIQLTTLPVAPPPATIHLNVNAGQVVRTADSRWFGINTAVWDGYFNTSTTQSQLNEAGWKTLRFPGGSLSDEYYWSSNTSDTNTWTWSTPFSSFAHVLTNIGGQAIITVNYGTSTAAYAASWVRNANVTNHIGVKYWEIGNENYGTWETDTNNRPHDPLTYATRAKDYITQMKAVDPTIKIGVVVETGEDSWGNGYTTPATNLTTHQVHSGWTPVLMSTLKSLGVTPDFAIYHWYPQSGADSDPDLLSGTTNWSGDAVNLRYMISNYFGTGGTNIELVVTENNSDSGPPGKQSVSLVNALYYADSFGHLSQTEFNGFLWWDLRNGEETDGQLDSSIYGWRQYGDLGVMNGIGTNIVDRYPPFFSAKMIQKFIRGGDSVVTATSDYSSMSVYAAHRTNGSLTLLVINKDSTNTLTNQISLGSFVPSAAATEYFYGIPQDQAAEFGSGSCDITTNAATASTQFTYAAPPYSITVFLLAPQAATLTPLGGTTIQLSGQPGTPYVLQTSTNLTSGLWTSVSTNWLVSSNSLVTNSLLPAATSQYWRAVWMP